jgi:hypothetical protein
MSRLLPKTFLAAMMLSFVCSVAAQTNIAGAATDSDHDGLSDALENALLARFAPTFMVSRADCSAIPAQFVPGDKTPTVMAEDGTIYGQAFPRSGHANEIELHYYHLWRRDCGEMGHALDAEHVSAVILMSDDPGKAKALYWYAAAHEDTICDASQVVRASTIGAEEHGATVWISEGKHASFLSEQLCRHGCGGDRCDQMEKLPVRAVVNVGESQAPMNGIAWLHSPAWPLETKLERSDFTVSRLQRVDGEPQTDVVWANPSKRPAQATILGLNDGVGGAATGLRATNTAMVIADGHTSSAMDTATDKTGSALGRSSRDVWKALKKSVQKTGEFLDGGGKK